MNANICRAYRILTDGQNGQKRGQLEISELPSRTHLLISFTNTDVPGGVGLTLDRDLAIAFMSIVQELEGRMDGPRPKATRTITVKEEKRADDDLSF